MTIQEVKMVDLKSTVYALQNILAQKSGEDMYIHYTSEAPIHATIWAKDNKFPLHILNAGSSQSNTWDGDSSVIKLITDMELNGFSLYLVPRSLKDETGFIALHEDFKIVIRS